MGRIRTVEITSITKELLSKYPLESDFSDDFSKNKAKLKSLPEELPSKKVLNRVAGYITKLYKDNEKAKRELLGDQESEEA